MVFAFQFFLQFKALVWKNFKNLGKLSIISLIFLQLAFFAISVLIISSIPELSSTSSGNIFRNLGLSDFLESSVSSQVNIKIYFSPKTPKTIAIMETMAIQENIKIEFAGYDDFEAMLDGGFNDASLIHDNIGQNADYYFVHFPNDNKHNSTFGNFSIEIAKVKHMVKIPQSYGYGGDGGYSRGGSTSGFTNEYLDIHLMASLNAAIYGATVGKSTPKMKISFKQTNFFQTINSKYTGPKGSDFAFQDSLRRIYIPLMLNLGYSLGSLIFLMRPFLYVVEEKRQNLINLLRQMNLIESVYWVSYLVIYSIFALFSSLIAAGYISDADSLKKYMKDNQFGSMFSVFLASNVYLVSFGLFLGSLCRRPGVVNVALALTTITAISISVTMSLPSFYQPPLREWTVFMTTIMKFSRSVSLDWFIVFSIFLPFFTPFKYFANIIEQNRVYGNSTEEELLKSFMQGTLNETNDLVSLPLLGSFILISLAWYFCQVFGDPDLAFQKGWLFFLPFGKEMTADKIFQGDTSAEMRQTSASNRSFLIRKISKSYGAGSTAVKEFSGELHSGHCYVLLGPNGSGKTTLVKMLSGTCHPTNGQAYLFGNSIQEKVSEIYKISSCCYQENILWENLTVMDHFYIVSCFRGVQKDWRTQANRLLELVDLSFAKNRVVRSYSGGMKRRTSFILSIFGNPKIVYLDEPTTGLDPVNRRKVWNLVQEIKKDKIVILTTHAMEEADALGDHIFIMNSGKLAASGSSLFLKNHYGVGFQIKVLSKDEKILSRIGNLATRSVSSAQIQSLIAGELLMTIPRGSMKQLILFLKTLQKIDVLLQKSGQGKGSDSAGATMEWSISNTTLEQVFITVSRSGNVVVEENVIGKKCQLCKSRKSSPVTLFNSKGLKIDFPDLLCLYCCQEIDLEAEKKKEDEKNTKNLSPEKLNSIEMELEALLPEFENDLKDAPAKAGNMTGRSLSSLGKTKRNIILVHLGACLYKNFSYEMKQKRMNICLLIFIILDLISMVLFFSVFSNSSSGKSGIQGNSPTARTHYCWTASEYRAKVCTKGQFYQYVKDAMSTCRADICSTYSPDPKYERSWFSQYSNLYWFYFNEEMKLPILWYSTEGEGKGALLGSSFANLLKEKALAQALPKQVDAGNLIDLSLVNIEDHLIFDEDQIMSICGESWYPAILRSVNESALPLSFPFPENGGWHMTTIDDVPQIRTTFIQDFRFSIKVERNFTYDSRYTDCGFYRIDDLQTFNPDITRKLLMTLLDSSLSLQSSRLNNYTFLHNFDFDAGVAFPLTGVYVDSAQIISLSSFFVFNSMLLLPRIADMIVIEKIENIYYLLRVSGVSMVGYWLGHIGFYLPFLFFLNLVVILILGLVSWFSLGVNYLPLIFALFLWCGNVVSIGFIIGAIVGKRQSAYFYSYFAAIVITIMSSYMAVLENVHFLDWVPSVSIIRLVVSIIRKQTIKDNPYIPVYYAFIFVDIFVLFTIAVAYSEFKALYADSVSSFFAWIKDGRKSKIDIELAPVSEPEDEDISLAAKMAKMLRIQGSKDDATEEEKRKLLETGALCDGLSKSYDGKTILLKGLSFSIQKNECFALLGKNGCGKTTLLSILMGLRSASGGYHSIFGSRKPQRGIMGVCPQFDALYADLTVEEHLKFYCKLSDLDSVGHSALIQVAAEKVGLDGDAFRLRAGSLSGGQKRRLSMAISIVSMPKLILLDEPTTGIDPENRQKIWEIIHSLRSRDMSGGGEGTTIILTTHSMEEADALASRIGILSKSTFQALGTPLHLKKKFGRGYRLSAIMTVTSDLEIDGKINRFKEFLGQTLKNLPLEAIKLIGKPYKSLVTLQQAASSPSTMIKLSFTLMIETMEIDMASLFESMSEKSEKYDIIEWAISGSTMEDVFLRIVQDEDE